MAAAHFLRLFLEITQAAMDPKTARSTREQTVITTELPKADQKRKFELLTTLCRLLISWLKEAPAKETGLATMALCFLKAFKTTR